jgi:PAS domain S-box-containing protein
MEEGPHSPRADEDAYRALFEAAPIGLGVADLEGRLLIFNHAMMQPGGYTRPDIVAIGNVAHLYGNEADRDRILAIAQTQGFVWRQEVQFKRKSGSCYDALLSLVPVQFGGRRCWLAAVEDITERKQAEARQRQLEEQLRQAQKMEAVGRMTASIAHDFNNILAVIIASSEVMTDTLAGDAGPHREGLADSLRELRGAAGRGVTMIGRLLGYSRHAALHVELADLASLVDDVQGMMRHLIPAGVRLELQCTPGSIAAVDRSAVEQILLNLVTNARDAMPEGGTLRIGLQRVASAECAATLPWMTPGAYMRLSVTDTGVGMDEATRARAFEPFFTTKPPGAGTGLGLSMVYGLVKQQHGFAEVQSTPGSGTTVNLYFPVGRDGGGSAGAGLGSAAG